MTERELLELAAKAAGFSVWTDIDGNIFSEDQEGIECKWNPLVDDSDALRLAIAIGLESIEFVVDEWPDHDMGIVFKQPNLSATRRAIVRAAAEIGKNMK